VPAYGVASGDPGDAYQTRSKTWPGLSWQIPPQCIAVTCNQAALALCSPTPGGCQPCWSRSSSTETCLTAHPELG
jgi:hypothetical protein